MASPRNQSWMDLYTTAYLERDPEKLLQRIAEAEQAIMKRQQEIARHTGPNDAERRSLEFCLNDLSVLREEEGAIQLPEPRQNSVQT